MASLARKVIYLETSSYLPLVWRTPYSQSLLALLARYATEYEFILQHDCILEASGYLSFEDNWKYHPAVRIRRLLERTADQELAEFGYPSAALQLLLGGNIWPQARYLNYVRHTAFFFADLLDGLDWQSPRQGLLEFAERIESRTAAFRRLFQTHASAYELRLPDQGILPYWGKWHLPRCPQSFRIQVVPDPRPHRMTAGKLRDIYHYDCALSSVPPPEMMLVANTGFARNVRASFETLPCPIICAQTDSAAIFG